MAGLKETGTSCNRERCLDAQIKMKKATNKSQAQPFRDKKII